MKEFVNADFIGHFLRGADSAHVFRSDAMSTHDGTGANKKVGEQEQDVKMR